MAYEERANQLRSMEICRFCLDDRGPLANIHESDGRSVPLPLQIMACVAIEVFKNDGMPQLICHKCKLYTQQAYAFKATCKKSDDALKLYLATGDLKTLQKFAQKEVKVQIVMKKRSMSSEATAEATAATPQKKQRTETATVVAQSPALEAQEEEEEDENELPQSPTTVELKIESLHREENVETASENQDEEEEEDDEDYDEDNINPVLKVPQVKTDVFPCNQCERSFPLKQLLDLHTKNHERERGYNCSLCNRKFFTKYDLAKHLQTHSDDKPYECVVCKKTFSRESLLHRHEKTHVEVPKYLCTTCDRTFLTRDDLDIHMEKHNKKRPYSCHICSKSFVFKQGLERHEQTHAEEKSHKCNYCEASFTTPIKLMRHITTHAGLRPYPCKICSRTFLLSHHLTRHMRSHYASKNSDVPPVGQHKCDLCSMSFKRKDSLINHSTIHSMVNLKCVICNTSFDNAKQVMNHITTHLSGLPYTCDKCDYSFQTQHQLEEHELKHAEMEYEEQIEQEVSQEEAKKFVEEELGDAEEDEDEEDDDDDDDDVVEFTITNTEDAEIVRRPQRQTKIKNYAQFLKDELGSDVEDELIKDGNEEAGAERQQEQREDAGEAEEEERGGPELRQEVRGAQSAHQQSIKPIVRSEGTKVYTRKGSAEKSKTASQAQSAPALAAISDLNQITTIENLGLTPQDLQALPNKQYVDMKIGDKTLRVQKLMMTKAEIEAMAKQGKIEMKGDTILLRKTIVSTSQKPMPFRHTMETIIDSNPRPLIQKPVVKKTYVKKANSQQDAAIKPADDPQSGDNNPTEEETTT